MSETILWQFFYRASNRDVDKMLSSDNVRYVELQLPTDISLEDALAKAVELGHMSKGNRQSACFEIQTDHGIWARPDESSFYYAPHLAEFKTWEQLEAEELVDL
jgi:hypothetical protein